MGFGVKGMFHKNLITLLTLIIILLSFNLTACQSEHDIKSTVPRFETLATDQDFPISVPSAFRSTLGYLVVAENRDIANSSTIKLPVAIIHAREDGTESPVIYLSGGPGTSALSAAAYPGAYPWVKDRDFIVFGQRGTHYAQPVLMCPEYKTAAENGDNIYTAIADCRDRLSNSDIDLLQYNSVRSAEDIEDLRRVLEHDSINLYSVSYGTRLALSYARLFPKHLRAMVLDSPLPPNALYDDESARNFEAALLAVADDCVLQDVCAAAFPNLKARFIAAISDKNMGKGDITLPELLSQIDLTSENAIRYAPLIMEAVIQRDPRLFESEEGKISVSDFAWGMRLSTWCAEAWPFSQRSRLSEAEPVLGGYESAAIDPKFCDIWRVEPLPEDFVAPVSSDIPTLILAGEFDPLTPPKWGDLAATSLSKSRVISVRGEGHSPTQNWGGDGCAMDIASKFIDSPETIIREDYIDHCVFQRAAPDYVTEEP